MRKLVTIRKISALYPIPNADRIVQAVIDGWTVIVKKDEFNVGDSCLFFEIDSFLPNIDVFSFLGTPKEYQGKLGYRLKTMKMKGVLSQGLALPLSLFPDITDLTLKDYSEQLNVIKYDVADVAPAKTGQAASSFPSFIPKTDQERIQNLSRYFDIYKDDEFEETLKLDGSSMTCYKIFKKLPWYQQCLNTIAFTFNLPIPFEICETGVCSRNVNLKDGNNNFWNTQRKYNILDNLQPGYAVQGELVGPSIQANHEKLSELEYYIFDVYDIDEQRYLLPSERKDFIEQYLPDAKHVPIVNPAIKIFKDRTLSDLLAHVEGSSMQPNTVSEGRVYKHTSTGISFKVISNKYLLKCEQ